jgi:Homing endonuclease associated repeat
MTKEEVIAALKECAARLGHVPSQAELKKTAGVMPWNIRKTFGTYGRTLAASGLKRTGSGYALDHKTMFGAWAIAARRLGKIPTAYEYEEHSRLHATTLVRWSGGWKNVPSCLLEYMRKEHLEGEWKDVQEVILKHLAATNRNGCPMSSVPSLASRPKIMLDQPMYGGPLLGSPLAFAPINEAGVMLMFGAVARQLGFVITRVQQEFPDCEALRQVDRDRWQRVLIEFEYESRNFLLHEHSVDDCDLIVCWNHNWPECPIEVLELKNVVWQ